jgi:hypothetical protein
MTLQHSKRAKSGTRKQVNGWIREMQSIVTLKTKEVEKFKYYRKFKLPGQAKMEAAAEKGLNQAKKDLAYFKNLKIKYEEKGLI